MMSLSFIGALVGLALGGAGFGFLRALAGRVDLPETRKALKVAGLIELVFFPVAGWFIVPLLFGE
ncbi:MAG: hypothetical protein M9944_00280 [Rhizobiaceae bacterium]|nr:hypothetical protein [Rhizobiaceae bacterium]